MDLYLYSLLFLAVGCSSNELWNQPDSCRSERGLFSEIVTSMASRLVEEIAPDKNFIISPLSISAALVMLYIGTDGETKFQMSSALRYNISENNNPDSEILEGFRSLLNSLQVENDLISLALVNSIFIQRGYRISPNYMSKIQNFLNSEVNYVDFANEEELSMKTINQWVSNKTKRHIRKLLNEPLDKVSLMVLANVIYFKGLWEYPFQETWNSFFHTRDGRPKIVSFMRVQQDFNYYHDDSTNYSFLEMDYVGGNISMLIILPRSIREIPKFHLTSANLCDIRSKLEIQTVMVGLPRFHLEYRRELSKDMEKFGMTELFSDHADLSGISEQNELHVSLMIHKAVIDVNEQGSTVSALSGVGIDSRKKPSHIATFWANHPFLFYIIDKRMETILFVGKVSDP